MTRVVVIAYDLGLERVTINVADVFDISAEFYLSFLVAIITIDVFYSVTQSFARNRLDLMDLTAKRLKNPEIVELVILLSDTVEDHLALENVAVLIVVTAHELRKF
jgi:hypothetical protein